MKIRGGVVRATQFGVGGTPSKTIDFSSFGDAK